VKPGSREAVNEVLRRLPYRERASVTKDALESAVETMPEVESAHVLAMAETLAGSTNKMGSLIALEILAAVGMLWSENGE
jgi:predicted nucleic acid-binding OB-fold protein